MLVVIIFKVLSRFVKFNPPVPVGGLFIAQEYPTTHLLCYSRKKDYS